jgi:hypothetical protein
MHAVPSVFYAVDQAVAIVPSSSVDKLFSRRVILLPFQNAHISLSLLSQRI